MSYYPTSYQRLPPGKQANYPYFPGDSWGTDVGAGASRASGAGQQQQQAAQQQQQQEPSPAARAPFTAPFGMEKKPRGVSLHNLGIGGRPQAPVGTFPWQQQTPQTYREEAGPLYGPKVANGAWTPKNNAMQMLVANGAGGGVKAGVIGKTREHQEATEQLNKQLQVVQLGDENKSISKSLLGLAQGNVTANGLTNMASTLGTLNQKDFTWKLQKPGMVFAKQTSAEKKNGKAERKNTNQEPKAWLYAWLGFRHKRPEYSHQSVGQRPDQYFKCSLVVEGFTKKAFGQATSKKEAQTEAAWEFIAFLKETNELTPTEAEHVAVMKKKLKGEKGSVRESLNSTLTTDTTTSETKEESANMDQYEKIKKEVEQSKENECWIEPNPPWLRGNQQMTPVDVFWRTKDLEVAGNGTGGPVSGTPGGAGITTEPLSAPKEPTGSPLTLPPLPIPFDPSIPPPPFPPPPPPPGDIPPVIYYPPTPPQLSTMEDTPEKTQTASNIRTMLDDITKELESESSLQDEIPRRNDELEPLDLVVISLYQAIAMKEDTFNTLCKVRQLVEKGLRDLSNHLVYEECVSSGDVELVDFCRERILNQRPAMKILSRAPAADSRTPAEVERDEGLKARIMKLRTVRKVIRAGTVAMDILTLGDSRCDLVLFTSVPPTVDLIRQIAKVLPTLLDKSLNLGVEMIDEMIIRVSGEVLNERVSLDIRLTTEAPLTDVSDEMAAEIESNLRRVRQVNWWTKVWPETYRIMDHIGALFVWLRRQEHGAPLMCLSEWQLMLVAFFALGSIDGTRLSPGDAVLRIFETLSSGMISPLCQVIDPSELTPSPFLAGLEEQACCDLAAWAGRCLRLISFGRIEDVFELDQNNNHVAAESTLP